MTIPESMSEEAMKIMRLRWFSSLEGQAGLHILLGSRLLFSPEARKVFRGYFSDMVQGFLNADPSFFERMPESDRNSFVPDFLDGRYSEMEAQCMNGRPFGRPIISTARDRGGEAELCAVRAVNPEYRLDEDWELFGEIDDLSMDFPCDMLPAWGTGPEWNRYIAECAALPEAVADARLKKAIFALETAIDSIKAGTGMGNSISGIFSPGSSDPTVKKILAVTASENLALPQASAFLFFNARLACVNMHARLMKNLDAREREDVVAGVIAGGAEERILEDSEFRQPGAGSRHARPGSDKGKMAFVPSESGEEDGPGTGMGPGELSCGPGLGL